MTCGIYLITHAGSGRKYVGQSINIEARVRNHPFGKRGALARAIAEYGWHSFTTAVICECDAKELNKQEAKWVEHFGCMHPHGFNRAEPGREHSRGDELVPLPASKRQARSRKARAKAGGKSIAVTLSPPAADALAKLLDSRYADSQKEAIERALMAAARYA